MVMVKDHENASRTQVLDAACSCAGPGGASSIQTAGFASEVNSKLIL